MIIFNFLSRVFTARGLAPIIGFNSTLFLFIIVNNLVWKRQEIRPEENEIFYKIIMLLCVKSLVVSFLNNVK